MNKRQWVISASEVNKKLDVQIFDETQAGLVLIDRSKKEIKKMMIDDLISNGKWSHRLIKLVQELENEQQ